MKPTIQDVIDRLTEPAETVENTVDTLLFGDPETEVSGIVSAFMPTVGTIEQAIRLEANLIISHEGPFFSHRYSYELESDPVCRAKRRLIEDSGIAIFRFHDYLHRYRPDGVTEGLLRALGWENHVLEHQAAASIVRIPPATVGQIAELAKQRLEIPYVRVMGDLDLNCERIGVLVGYRGGGATALPLFEREELELVIYGEGPEWETPEYVRDAISQGKRRALIVLGHAESEEPGMELLAGRLRQLFPGLPVRYVKERPLFRAI